MFKYEDLSNVDRTKAVFAAENSIHNGWERRGYPNVKMDNVPWKLTNPEERSWNFLIHSWDMIDSQFKAYEETNDNKYIYICINVVDSWINYISSVDEKNKLSSMVWYDMAIGLRAYRLAYLIDISEELKLLSEEQLNIFWNILELHQKYLSDDSNIVFHNNHGFYQVAGQLAMGRRFAERSTLMA
ncbi:MAG: hypothetical protein J0647_01805, partial [Campylobacteraceae bacterium]|nr:hypothetical protein [Campylobacteraceae bacterium]